MANDFTANPWTVDTAFAAIPSKGHITGSYIKASTITWTSMAAAAQCIITDKNGKIIINSTDAAANTPIVLANPGWINGLLVPTLTSGLLTIAISKS